MKQFEIYYADLSPIGNSSADNLVIILQKNINDKTKNIICAPITSKEPKGNTHIDVITKDGKCMYIMLEHMRNMDRERLKNKIREIDQKDYQRVNNKLAEVMMI